MSKSRCGVGRRRRALVILVVAASGATGVACDDSRPVEELTADGRVWRESVAENFSVELTTGEANCLAAEVQDLTRLVGPLVGQRPDDTARSVFPAVDACLSAVHQGEVAAAIVLGPDGVRGQAAVYGECVRRAGGWGVLASYQQLVAACGAAGSAS